MIQWITMARSWSLLARIGIAAILVVVATAIQWPISSVEVPGNPFLLYFVVVAVAACALGRAPGFVAAATSSIASTLFFEPFFSFKVSHAVDLLAIEAYAVIAALSVEAFCRLVDGALAEKSDATLARMQRQEARACLAEREAQLALFVEYAPVAIAMFDSEMRYLAVSRRFLSDYELPAAADVIGRSHYEIFPDIPQRWRKIHSRVLAGEELSHEGTLSRARTAASNGYSGR